MSRCVNQIERIGLAVGMVVFHLDSVALDGDTLLAFEVHIIEHLSLHFALIERVSIFEQAVGQGTFAVVDMRDNTEVANIFHIYSIFNFARKYTQKILYII